MQLTKSNVLKLADLRRADKMNSGRLIPLSSHSAAMNMSIDQAILESVDAGAPPTLRFYGWSKPSLSLGYFQKVADRRLHQKSVGIDCVRRSTGGGAIVHHHELTYSIAIPTPQNATGARKELYRAAHDGFIRTLAEFGVRAYRHADVVGRLSTAEDFLCFRRRTDDDLVVSGYKVLGSAQRRARSAVLQHGSLLIRSSEFAPELPGIHNLTSRPIDAGELCSVFAKDVGASLDVKWAQGDLAASESRGAERIEETRFGAPEWLNRR